MMWFFLKIPWSRILTITGGLAMLLGAIDPLEGSVLILAGSALVLLGTFLGQRTRQLLLYWVVVFFLILAGVGAMFGLSAVGGIGGSSGRSLWWGIVILPYPAGWVMGMVSLVLRIVNSVRRRHAVA